MKFVGKDHSPVLILPNDKRGDSMIEKQRKNKFFHFLTQYPIIFVIVIFIVLMAAFVPGFATGRNIQSLFMQMSIYGIAMVGLVFALIGGGIDLSLASNAMLSGLTCAYVMTRIPGAGILGGILAGMAVGIIIGAVNGLIGAKFGVNPFIGTISMQLFINGIGIVWSNGQTIGGLPKAFTVIGKAKIIGIPLIVILMLLFYVAGHYITKKTAYGRKLYACGTNPEAAKLVGIPVVKIRLLAFMICGFCASVAGMVSTARLAAATPSPSSDLFLDTLCASIIGGASLSGGKGNVAGATLGILLLCLISNGVNLLGIDRNVTLVVKGIIIFMAIVLDLSKGKTKIKKVLVKKAA